MSLVVGVNAYCDIAEADSLITSRFMSNNPIRKYWSNLSNDDKSTLIVGNTAMYDNDGMLYKWFKQDKTQPLQFPRITQFGDVIECPDNIKLGIILQGLKDCMVSESTEGEMMANGIKSFQDGTGAKIEFDNSSNAYKSNSKNSLGLYNNIWRQYFSEYSDAI